MGRLRSSADAGLAQTGLAVDFSCRRGDDVLVVPVLFHTSLNQQWGKKDLPLAGGPEGRHCR